MNNEEMVAPPASPDNSAEIFAKVEPAGFGGWLLLVGAGILLAIVFTIVKYFFDGFGAHPIFDLILVGKTMPLPAPYPNQPFWLVVVTCQIAANVGLVVAWICLAVLFFRKSKRFPLFYALALAANFAFHVCNALIMGAALPEGSPPDPNVTQALGGSLITAAIWITYILISKRVRATFVK